jgi:hypothetical protein
MQLKTSEHRPHPHIAHAGAQALGGSGSEGGEKAVFSDYTVPFGQSLVLLRRTARRDGADDESRAVASGTGEPWLVSPD